MGGCSFSRFWSWAWAWAWGETGPHTREIFRRALYHQHSESGGGGPASAGGGGSPLEAEPVMHLPSQPPKNTRNTPYPPLNTLATEMDHNIQTTQKIPPSKRYRVPRQVLQNAGSPLFDINTDCPERLLTINKRPGLSWVGTLYS